MQDGDLLKWKWLGPDSERMRHSGAVLPCRSCHVSLAAVAGALFRGARTPMPIPANTPGWPGWYDATRARSRQHLECAILMESGETLQTLSPWPRLYWPCLDSILAYSGVSWGHQPPRSLPSALHQRLRSCASLNPYIPPHTSFPPNHPSSSYHCLLFSSQLRRPHK